MHQFAQKYILSQNSIWKVLKLELTSQNLLVLKANDCTIVEREIYETAKCHHSNHWAASNQMWLQCSVQALLFWTMEVNFNIFSYLLRAPFKRAQVSITFKLGLTWKETAASSDDIRRGEKRQTCLIIKLSVYSRISVDHFLFSKPHSSSLTKSLSQRDFLTGNMKYAIWIGTEI